MPPDPADVGSIKQQLEAERAYRENPNSSRHKIKQGNCRCSSTQCHRCRSDVV